MSKPKRIAIVGPECTGKTSLAKALAEHYNTIWVPEFAREYIENLNRPYNQHDLVEIAKGQLLLEDNLTQHAGQLVICDTTLVVIKIWSEFKFGSCVPQILQEMHKRNYDLTLLTHIDVPWEHDPQREHPEQREELFNIYIKELKQQRIDFALIKGTLTNRLNRATQSIDKLF